MRAMVELPIVSCQREPGDAVPSHHDQFPRFLRDESVADGELMEMADRFELAWADVELEVFGQVTARGALRPATGDRKSLDDLVHMGESRALRCFQLLRKGAEVNAGACHPDGEDEGQPGVLL